MNNKNIILGVGFVLLSIITYQGYELYKLNHQNISKPIQQAKEDKISKKNTPQININIGKNSTQKSTRAVSNLTPEQQIEEDKKRIKKSVQELLKSIFASKEVQDGLSEFKTQAQIGLKELQTELQNLPKELDKLSTQLQDDPLLSQFFQGLKDISGDTLEDRGDFYYTKIALKDGKNSKIDISTNDHYLSVFITDKNTHTTKNNNSTTTQYSSYSSKNIFLLPQDALVEKIQTNYKNNTLEITIPKIKKSKKI